MKIQDFYPISIRGRLAYSIMCFEKYVVTKYPELDFSYVCSMLWDIVSDKDYIDISSEKYMEIIPEYLFEFSSYEEAEFEYLSKEDYESLIKLIPAEDFNLNAIMHRIYDIAMENAYSALEAPSKSTINMLFEIINILKEQSISLPNMTAVERYSFEESGGWGSYISRADHSIIIK